MSLSDGWAGTNQTVAKIMQLVDDSLIDPLVVTTAQNIVRNVRERDRMAELRAISAFIRSKIRYTNESIETLKTPRLMVQEIQKYGKAVGDCDDSVILWMALLKSIGHKVRAVVVSQRRDKAATHIYAEDFINGKWVSDDTIVKYKPLGWAVPERERTVTRHYAAMGGIQMQDYLQVGAVKRGRGHGRRRSVTRWERQERSPFARFTIFSPGVRQQAVSDFLPPKEYFGGEPVRRPVNTKVGGMIEVNEWGMGEAIGFIPGSLGEVGKAKWGKILKVVKKVAPYVVGGGIVGTGIALAAKAAKAAAAAKKAKAAKADASGELVPESSSAAITASMSAPSGPASDSTMLYVGLGAAALLLIVVVMGRK